MPDELLKVLSLTIVITLILLSTKSLLKKEETPIKNTLIGKFEESQNQIKYGKYDTKTSNSTR